MQEILLLRKTLPSRSIQNIHQRKYLCEVMHNRVFYTSQKVRIRVVRCPGVSFISTRRGFDSMVLHKNLVQSGFYTSQKV